MKKRTISLFLAFVMLLGILPVTSFAAPTLEEAMAEVDVYAKDETLNWLTMNGSVKEQHYTYYKYESVQTGQVKEIPAYCVDPNLYGVPKKVPEGTPIKYSGKETMSDYKLVGIVANGYSEETVAFRCFANGPRKGRMVGIGMFEPYVPAWCPKMEQNGGTVKCCRSDR